MRAARGRLYSDRARPLLPAPARAATAPLLPGKTGPAGPPPALSFVAVTAPHGAHSFSALWPRSCTAAPLGAPNRPSPLPSADRRGPARSRSQPRSAATEAAALSAPPAPGGSSAGAPCRGRQCRALATRRQQRRPAQPGPGPRCGAGTEQREKPAQGALQLLQPERLGSWGQALAAFLPTEKRRLVLLKTCSPLVPASYIPVCNRVEREGWLISK